MLKDITLGQYFPGNTIVHRLDPRTKLIAVVIYIVALFVAGNFSPRWWWRLRWYCAWPSPASGPPPF